MDSSRICGCHILCVLRIGDSARRSGREISHYARLTNL
jgi:hypothetical protein